MGRFSLREKAIRLREGGKTFAEIKSALKVDAPKSTLSFWCKGIPLPLGFQRRIREYNKFNLEKARKIALEVNRIKRKEYLQSIFDRNKHLKAILDNREISKIVLATLYLAEGTKSHRGSLIFGNSDPFIVSLFVYLLRYCYKIDERKFRCTLQCRADQNIKKLEKFWSRITKIPSKQFYKARVDPRTIGKKSKKLDYKGVCRIDYFSGDIFLDLLQIPKIIYKGP